MKYQKRELYMKKKFNFEVETEKKPHSVGVNFNTKPNKNKYS